MKPGARVDGERLLDDEGRCSEGGGGLGESVSVCCSPAHAEEQDARAGAAVGCHEALFTLGEAPEERYPSALEWLRDHGYASTVAPLDTSRAISIRRGSFCSRGEIGRERVTNPYLLDLDTPAPRRGL